MFIMFVVIAGFHRGLWASFSVTAGHPSRSGSLRSGMPTYCSHSKIK